jgi:hypothetical protein
MARLDSACPREVNRPETSREWDSIDATGQRCRSWPPYHANAPRYTGESMLHLNQVITRFRFGISVVTLLRVRA